MNQIRRNIFETNSSSTHSLTMCPLSDYEGWQEGKFVYDRWECKLVECTDEIETYRKVNYELNSSYTYGRYLTFDEYWDHISEYYESFEETCNNTVAFGYYGWD